jgi:hypothetical protein
MDDILEASLLSSDMAIIFRYYILTWHIITGTMMIPHTTSAHKTFVHGYICLYDICPDGHLPRTTLAQNDICPEVYLPRSTFKRKLIHVINHSNRARRFCRFVRLLCSHFR